MNYNQVRNFTHTEVAEAMINEPLSIFGCSIDIDFNILIEYLCDSVIWESNKKILYVTRNTLNFLNVLDNLISSHNELNLEHYFINKKERIIFSNIETLVDIAKVINGEIPTNSEDNKYDIIILDDVDDLIDETTFARLFNESKKIILKTIDRPESIIYKMDLKAVFYKIPVDIEKYKNVNDYFLYRKLIASFDGFLQK